MYYSAGIGTIQSTGLNCGPSAAALAIALWSDRGFNVMQSGAGALTLTQLADSLAARAMVTTFGGAKDEFFCRGLVDYCRDHGDILELDYRRFPDYYELRTWVEDEQRSVIIGLSGPHGLWLTVDGFSGWPEDGGNPVVVVSDPLTAATRNLEMRNSGTKYQLNYGGNWHDLD
jgi:hypothetical protein